MGTPIDALTYATMSNNLTSDSQLSEFQNKLQNTTLTTGTSNLDATSNALINGILDKTQIKRACCNNRSTINVRIPIPTGVTPVGNANGALMSQYGYYDKPVTIDLGICKTPAFQSYQPGTTPCDDFYTAYCSNVVNEFTAGNGNKFDDTEFLNYKAECACYIPEPAWLTQAWGGTPIPKCVYPGCSANTTAYLDPASRSQQCNYTICSQQINMGNVNVTSDSGIVNNIKAQCGQNNENPFVNSPSGVPSTTGGTESTPLALPTTGTTGTIGGITTTGTGITNTIGESLSHLLPSKLSFPEISSGVSAESLTNVHQPYMWGGLIFVSSCCFVIIAIIVFIIWRKKHGH